MEENKKEKEKERFELIEVTTETGLAFKDNTEDKILDSNQLLLKMINSIEELKKGLVG